MNDPVNWANPYAHREGAWLKGNLHAHTSPESPCGAISIEDSVNRYISYGYDFLSLSNHMVLTDHDDDRLTLLPGFEWNATDGEYHTGVYALELEPLKTAIKIRDHKAMLQEAAGNDALMILNHPNRYLRPHYRREEMIDRSGYDGLEIFNAVVDLSEGYSIATDKWDFLLANGRKVLGFAGDDAHREMQIGIASCVVRSESNSPADIMKALKSGNFYSSSGAFIEDIRREGDIIEIESADAEEIHVIATGGRRIHWTSDKSLSFNVETVDLSYVRFEVYGKRSQMAWTQPFFINHKEK